MDSIWLAWQNGHDWSSVAYPFAGHLVAALLILLIGNWVLKGLLLLARRIMQRSHVDETAALFFHRVGYGAGLVLVLVSALSQVGVDMTSVAAMLGGAALAIGLALQNQLASFACGVLLIVFRPFRIGEWVTVAGQSGSVREITMFATVIASLENQVLTIPNNKVWGDTITNHTRLPWRRIDMAVTISHDADLGRARQRLEAVLAEEPRVLKDPKPVVAISEVNANGVVLVVRPCAATSEWWDVRCALVEHVHLALRDAGVALPRTQAELWLHAAGGALTPAANQ